MSDASDSQNLPSGEEPYAGEPSDLDSSESRMDLDQFLILPALGVEYSFESPEKTGGSPAPSVEGLVHRKGRSQPMDVVGLSERASMSGTGNHLVLIDEEGDDGNDEEGNEGGEKQGSEEDDEAGEEGEDEGLGSKTVDDTGAVTVAVANPHWAASKEPEEKKKKKKAKEIPPLVRPVNVTVDGDVGITRSIVTEAHLERIRSSFGVAVEVVLRIPEENEAACSRPESLDEVCLFEHMFVWGLRLSGGERLRSKFLVLILSKYRLSPGQLTANGFATILGF